MSADDDDYLSDKFLTPSSSALTKLATYSQLRKEAQKKSQSKNEQNRAKSRRQRELESREEGLSKSLFERAKEEEAAGIGSGNKALSIMMKMGFKPGQSLGNPSHVQTIGAESKESQLSPTVAERSTSPLRRSISGSDPTQAESHAKHKTEPLPIQEWAGRQGIGLGKRTRSPGATERIAKMAKMAEEKDHRDFRERARDEYNNRKAEGRLVPAQLTCSTLDEQMGKAFNVLWLNPNNPNTFPAGLMDALANHSNLTVGSGHQGNSDSIEDRLRKQMQADALYPLDNDDDGLTAKMKSSVQGEEHFSSDVLEEATQFLRLQVRLFDFLQEGICRIDFLFSLAG
ncbi:hypothetical protein NLJ89_g7652 [Agrocybe chaxingu]|uniref:G-patch domain-containing protein n=1 Tax=Agrocybe chaxingu TaxID=84603 RepID=A0A9W8MV86_9AGAR|nr:hypothetical protein NLJ89_g7652 [Agrocybe chaxingu]